MKKVVCLVVIVMIVARLVFAAEEDKQGDEAELPAWFTPLVSDQEVRDALQRNKDLIDMYNPDGYTGLQRAVIRGDLPQVELFVEAGAGLNLPVKNKSVQSGDTALILGIFGVNTRNDTKIPTYLIDKKADVIKPNTEGIAPIHRVLWVTDHNLRMNIAKQLVDRGADINAQTKQGNTMLHLTVEKYDKKWIDMIKEAFGSLLDFNVKNNDGLTPLELARKLQQLGDDSVVNSLLTDYEVLGEGWGGYAKTNKLGQTGLMLAIFRDDPAFVKRMIQRGANVNAQDNNGYTPLFYAVESEQPAYYVKELIAQGAEVKLRDKKGQTALMLVPKIKESKKRTEAARLLINAGSDIDAKDNQGNTVWHYAAQSLDSELIAFLKKEAGTIQKNKKGKTPVDVVKAQEKEKLSKEEQEKLDKTIKALEL